MQRLIFGFRTFYQVGCALLIVVALCTQFIYGAVVAGTLSVGYVGLFVSYFTIVSNILVAIVLCAEAKADIKGAGLSARLDRLRALATFCIITTGITYTFFLRGPAAGGILADSIPWINSVFHQVMPVVMTLDWVLFPTKSRVRWRSIAEWIGFTALYLVYVELLGRITHSYPYFFLDPVRLHGYLGVGRAALGFIPFFLVFGAFVVIANRTRLRFMHHPLIPARIAE